MGYYDTDGYYWDEDEDAEDRERDKEKAKLKRLNVVAYEIATNKRFIHKNGYVKKIKSLTTTVIASAVQTLTNSDFEIKYAKEAIEVLKKEALTRDDAPRKWRKEQD